MADNLGFSTGMNWATNNGMTQQQVYGNIRDWFKQTPNASVGDVQSTAQQYGLSSDDVNTAITPYNTGTQQQGSGNTFYDNNKGMTAPTMDSYQKNPYLDQMAQGITDQMNQNWERNLAPSIRSGAMAAGGFGGSRQGVVEANALNDMNRSLGQNLTNLYGTDYTNDRNRALQKYSADQGYNLGMANNNLGYANLDANIYNSNFNNQLNSAQFGLNTYNTMMGYGQQGINNATTVQNTPLTYQNYFNGQYNAGGGNGGTTTQTTGTTSNPWMTGATAVKALGY